MGNLDRDVESRKPWKYKKSDLEAAEKRITEINELHDVPLSKSTKVAVSGKKSAEDITGEGTRERVKLPAWMRDAKKYGRILQVYGEYCKGRTVNAIAKMFAIHPDTVKKYLRRAIEARKIVFEALVADESLHQYDMRMQLHEYAWDTLEAIRDEISPAAIKSKAELLAFMSENITEMGVLTAVREDKLKADTEIRDSGGTTIYIDARGAPLGYDTPIEMMEAEWKEVTPDYSPNKRIPEPSPGPEDEIPDFSDLELDASLGDD